MNKKTRERSLTKKFNTDDVNKWQEQANENTGGNLTLWIELTLNKAVRQQIKENKE